MKGVLFIKKIIKKSFKSALGVSIGVTLGGVVIPKVFIYPRLYNKHLENLFSFTVECILCFIVAFISSFLVFLICDEFNKSSNN